MRGRTPFFRACRGRGARPGPAVAPGLAAALCAAALLGCASGGGGGPLSGERAAAVMAAFSGTWRLDESSSSAQIPNELEGVPDETPVADVARNETREMRRYRRMYESRRISVAHMRTTIEVLRRRPGTLILALGAGELAYTPVPGETLTIPADGSQSEITVGDHRVRASMGWEGPLLSIEHQVVSGGRVKETLEAIGDRLIMRRWITTGGAGEPLVLAYDRN